MKLFIWNIVILMVISMAVAAPCSCQESPEDYIEFEIVHDKKGRFPLKVRKDDTVRELKSKVATYVGIPALEQKLRKSDGAELKDDSVKLKDANIDGVKYLIVSEINEEYESYVKLADRHWNWLSVNVRKGETVWDIKVKLAPIIGVAAYEQRLYTKDGIHLHDFWTYGSDKIKFRTTFHVKYQHEA